MPYGFKSFDKTLSPGHLTAAFTDKGPTPQNMSHKTCLGLKNS